MLTLEEALTRLEASDVVGLPTETVYGLAARIDRPEGIKKIFRVKERPFFDPLIVHVASIEQAQACASDWPAAAQTLAEKFWPGPLTLVLPKAESIDTMITSGLLTVGLRCPDHPIALELIRRTGVGLAAPSANRFGRTSPTRPEHVRDEFQDQVGALDGGPCSVGIESSIVAVSGSTLKLLRPGLLTPEILGQALLEAGIAFQWEDVGGRLEAPGQMKHHYMPAKPLVLMTKAPDLLDLKHLVENNLSAIPTEVEGVHLLRPTRAETFLEVRLADDPALAARELYQRLRECSKGPEDLLYMVWPLDRREGPWLGVWDRLRKAASLQLE